MLNRLYEILYTMLLIFFISTIVWGQTYLPDLFQSLYSHHFDEYRELKEEDYGSFYTQFNLNIENEDNLYNYLLIYFLHDCFTGVSASDFSSGGFFEIPYFWHWVDPNPRHSIISLPDSVFLNIMEPTLDFARYQSYADIDRVPSLFLADLVTEKPLYYHSQCGAFYTFGWCSEREMSFALLLSLFGYEGKIKQSGIHTWSEFWVPFRRADSTEIILISKVDNTFNSLFWEIAPSGLNKADWINDFGTGEQIAWYNRKCRSSEQIQKVQNIIVSDSSAVRIDKTVEKKIEELSKN